MALERSNFDDIALADLQNLSDSQIPESRYLEYKQENYQFETIEARREFAKDVSAMANTGGGHLIIGMQARDGLADALLGMPGFDADRDILQLEQILLTGIEPRIYGLRIRALRLPSSNYVVVIRIPRSFNPPHRVVVGGVNRFYLRNAAGCYEPSVDELRTLFTMTSDIQDSMHQFLERRLDEFEHGPFYFIMNRESGIFMIHILPFGAFTQLTALAPDSVAPLRDHFRPPGAAHWDGRVNFDGYVFIRPGEPTHGYTQIFRNGIVEATKCEIVALQDGDRCIQGNVLIEDIVRSTKRYLAGLRELGVSPPFLIYISLLYVANTQLLLPDVHPGRLIRNSRARNSIVQSKLLLPPVEVTDYLDDAGYDRALSPAMDAFVNAAGEMRCPYFNADGLFDIPRR